MRRRTYLAATGSGLALGLAGCSGGTSPSGGDDEGATTDAGGTSATGTNGGTTGRNTVTRRPTEEVDLPVPKSELTRGARKDAIPAIVNPKFAKDWSSVNYSLSPDDEVIGVERGGEARAYPLSILNWHEIVNDTFDGPLLVTYCPLCGSGVTAKRTVNGDVTKFGVSGYLWNSDLVMYDEKTESLWSQILAKAIRGPETGDRLNLVPSSLTTLKEWRSSHPDTTVLLPPPKSDTIVKAMPRNYARDPYANYDETERVGIGANDDVDGRLHPKTQVIGISHRGFARAYPLGRVEEENVINDTVGGLPVVVTVDAGGSLVAYVRRADGEILEFEPDTNRHMTADGSRWERSTGRAVDGPHEGTTLERANDRSPMFWFAWADFHPKTEIYGGAARTTTDG